MNTRQEQILRHLVEDYLESAQPIASGSLANAHDLQVSSATIRNDMMHLEQEGYVVQPHTSAGRVPTVEGIAHYITNYLKPKNLTPREQKYLHAIFEQAGIKGVARAVAGYAKAAVVLTHNDNDYYYTGFSFLFNEPDFLDINLARAITKAVEKLELLLPDIMTRQVGSAPKIYIGDENPLGNQCSATFVVNNPQKSLMGIIAPLRTNYARHVGLLQSMVNYL